MDAAMCEEFLQVGQSKRLQGMLARWQSPTQGKKGVVRIRTRLQMRTNTESPQKVQPRSRSSPRRRTTPISHPPSPLISKATPKPGLVSALQRNSYIPYLDDISPRSSVSEVELKQEEAEQRKAAKGGRTPSVDSSNRRSSIYSKRALISLDWLESPREDRGSCWSTSRTSPRVGRREAPKKTRFEELKGAKCDDLYIFRKSPVSPLPTQRLRKLTGMRPVTRQSISPRPVSTVISTFQYPTPESEAFLLHSRVQTPLQLSDQGTLCSPGKRPKLRLPGCSTIRVKTVLPSPQVLPDL